MFIIWLPSNRWLIYSLFLDGLDYDLDGLIITQSLLGILILRFICDKEKSRQFEHL